MFMFTSQLRCPEAQYCRMCTGSFLLAGATPMTTQQYGAVNVAAFGYSHARTEIQPGCHVVTECCAGRICNDLPFSHRTHKLILQVILYVYCGSETSSFCFRSHPDASLIPTPLLRIYTPQQHVATPQAPWAEDRIL
ncbi:hypothetical protein OE88DRAFT_348029 [Heliocybe sulcata]|uniref:Uncharacterized protein n=1 Tax=Heliocybe sulcata TaxID=5364 RepID=A0A5C3MVK1_9AGAM|nr:hypothetical protein OE88DRAFT_348029 [Heliocybe sulcata]